MSQTIEKYFKGVAVKRLSPVEIQPKVSNQHEFNGTSDFKKLLGDEKRVFKTKFLYLSDNESENITEESTTTWYDAREKHKTRTEYRLYYKPIESIKKLSQDDLMVFCQIDRNNALVIFAHQGTTIEKQILWLFELHEVGRKFVVKDFKHETLEITYARNYILDSIGIETEVDSNKYLDLILKRFGNTFPSTVEFSGFARNTLKDVSAIDDPDGALIKWMEQEELLFKILEKHLVEEKLKDGFGKTGSDVDDFIKFSLSVHQRRKSRAGWAFDHHVAEVFSQCKIKYVRQPITEGKSKPDFIFPGIKEYKNKEFPTELLTMLGIKTTAKDRWRQILAEADRINKKHLLTLEPSISLDQTNEMKQKNVQLVLPHEIAKTYNRDQQIDIIDLRTFIKYVLKNQNRL